MLGLFQVSDEFEVLLEDGDVETVMWKAAYPEALGETSGPRFNLFSNQNPL